MEKICVVCGKNFTSNKSNHVCCSRKCRDKNTKIKKDTKCEYCGKIFKTNSNVKFCSKDCKLKNKENVFGKYNCEYCGKEFIKSNVDHKYCSSKCKVKHNEDRIYILRTEIVYCAICGKDIRRVKNSAKQNFCSKECKKIYMVEFSRELALERLSKGLIPTTNTKPQQICDSILKNLGVEYINEKRFDRYSIDTYLTNYDLCIEVMGDYWHSNSELFSVDKLNEMQINNIFRDVRKNNSLLEKFKIPVLYLWEKDLINNKDVCELLIIEYLKNNGVLNNYHSFNYGIINNNLKIKNNIIIPYMERDISTMNDLTRKLHIYEDAKV